ncbi:hypothetical protein [Pseudarthrobacter sp. Y6]|uniref:hypothetical protein n=1 Tax=Pseudarthrobacter sp. Y6 TaxID=3418422 RepID=UPI003CEB973C
MTAISVIEAGLQRHPEATDAEKLPLLVYLAGLHERTGDHGLARSALDSVGALKLDPEARRALASRTGERLRAPPRSPNVRSRCGRRILLDHSPGAGGGFCSIIRAFRISGRRDSGARLRVDGND